jgi:hypothetical protein
MKGKSYMNKFLLSILLIVVMLVQGCATTREITSEDTYYPLPEHLLTPCIAPVPPDKVKFNNLTLIDQHSALTTYVIKLLGSIKDCSDKVEAIKLYNEKMKNK